MTKSAYDLINELVEQKTFSLDALDRVKTLRDQVGELEMKRDTLMGQNDTLQRENNRVKTIESSLSERERAVTEREKNITTLERETAVAKAESAVYRDVVTRMFANRIVREANTTSQYVASSQPGMGPLLMPNSSTVTREEG